MERDGVGKYRPDRTIVATDDTCPACNRAYRVSVTIEPIRAEQQEG